jgi:AcrR family transcriptional regulator
MTLLSEPGRIGGDELSRIERIRNAALTCFAKEGTSATSLRTVAEAAGVSIGLVQHHFTNKAGLIKAVDDHVMAVVIGIVAPPTPDPPADSVAAIGERVTHFVREYPDVADYLGRALVDGSPLGNTIFDTMAAFGTARWSQRSERGELRPGVDLTWAALNGIVLALGTLLLRGHIERQLPESFTSPTQLDRWQASVNELLRHGLFRQLGDESESKP